MMDPSIFEQTEAALRDIAKVLANYFNCLVKEGFTREEAFILVGEYHMVLLGRVEK